MQSESNFVTSFPAIFEEAFSSVHNKLDKGYSLKIQEIGAIQIASGKIIVCDPVVLHDASSFEQEFPIGEYPVQLSIKVLEDDERVAFSRIIFSDAPVSKWEFALYPGEEKIPITGEEVAGWFGVDSGMGIFIDEKSRERFDFEKDFENVFIEKKNENYRYTWSYVHHEFNHSNLVAFSSGYGDGSYSSYVGKDKDGNICRLLIDFELFEWWNP